MNKSNILTMLITVTCLSIVFLFFICPIRIVTIWIKGHALKRRRSNKPKEVKKTIPMAWINLCTDGLVQQIRHVSDRRIARSLKQNVVGLPRKRLQQLCTVATNDKRLITFQGQLMQVKRLENMVNSQENTAKNINCMVNSSWGRSIWCERKIRRVIPSITRYSGQTVSDFDHIERLNLVKPFTKRACRRSR